MWLIHLFIFVEVFQQHGPLMITLHFFINKYDNYIEDISVPYILRGWGSLRLGLKRLNEIKK